MSCARFRFLFAVLATALLVAPAGARAQRAVPVSGDGCEGISLTRVEELLAIELGDAGPGDFALVVELSCGESEIRIVAREAPLELSFERVLPRPRPESTERTLAIVIALLLRAAERELLIEANAESGAFVQRFAPVAPAEPEGPPPQASDDEAAPFLARAAAPRPSPSAPPPAAHPPTPMRARIDLRAGARAHDFAAVFPTLRGALSLALPFLPELRLITQLAVEYGVVEAGVGRVEMQVYQVAIGLELELVRADAFALTGDLLVGGGYGRLAGLAMSGDVLAATVEGGTFEATLGVIAWFTIDMLRVGVRGAAGAGVGVEGAIEGEASVAYGRGVAEGTLIVALAW